MFILDDGKDAYVFPIDENFKMEGIKDGDQVTVTYTGELSVTGDTEFTTVKVEKANWSEELYLRTDEDELLLIFLCLLLEIW